MIDRICDSSSDFFGLFSFKGSEHSQYHNIDWPSVCVSNNQNVFLVGYD